MNRRWWRPGVVMDAAGYSFESIIRLSLMALVGVLVARYLGPEGLGLLSYATSVFAILGPLSLLGMRTILVREFSTRDDWQVILASALGRQLPIAILASFVGFLVIATTRGFERDAVLIALALTPVPVLATGDNLRALFEATGRVRLIVTVGLVGIGVTSLVRVGAVLVDAPIWVFAAAASLDALLLLVGFLIGVQGRASVWAVASQYRSAVARDLVRESWPLLLSGLAVLLYMRADIVMLGLLADDEATGIYVAATRFSELWYFVPVAVMAAVRPRLARLYAGGRLDEYHGVTQRLMAAAFGASVLAIVTTLLVGRTLIELVYGADFVAAYGVLRIHILATPFVFLGVAASQWFIDRGMTRAVMVRSAAGAGVNIALNFALIPAHGAIGAAVATLVSYGVAGVLLNGVFVSTRPVFFMQMRAFLFRHR